MKQSLTNAELAGMGTTLVAATIEDSILYVANVGDSRLYLIEREGISQITKDHSFVEEMVSMGRWTVTAVNTGRRKISSQELSA